MAKLKVLVGIADLATTALAAVKFLGHASPEEGSSPDSANVDLTGGSLEQDAGTSTEEQADISVSKESSPQGGS